MYGTIIRHGIDDHNSRSFRIRVSKTGHTRTSSHIKTTKISAEDYLWNEMSKANQTLAGDRLNELINHFLQLHKRNQHNKTEMEEKEGVSMDDTRNMPIRQMYRHT